MKWEVTLWPNNQAPIFLGVYSGTKQAIKEQVCAKFGISPDDDALCIMKDLPETGYKKWKKKY
jgi:hypothetical protein